MLITEKSGEQWCDAYTQCSSNWVLQLSYSRWKHIKPVFNWFLFTFMDWHQSNTNETPELKNHDIFLCCFLGFWQFSMGHSFKHKPFLFLAEILKRNQQLLQMVVSILTSKSFWVQTREKPDEIRGRQSQYRLYGLLKKNLIIFFPHEKLRTILVQCKKNLQMTTL